MKTPFKILLICCALGLSGAAIVKAESGQQLPIQHQNAQDSAGSAAPSIGFGSSFDAFDADWNPFDEMERMQQQMQHMFRNRAFNPAGFSPRMDVTEQPGKYVVSLDLPGMDKDKIDIKLTDNLLTVSGERKFEQETQDRQYHRVEQSYGYFERSIPVPEDVKPDGISARYEKGVLTLELARQEAAKASAPEKKIAVR